MSSKKGKHSSLLIELLISRDNVKGMSGERWRKVEEEVEVEEEEMVDGRREEKARGRSPTL